MRSRELLPTIAGCRLLTLALHLNGRAIAADADHGSAEAVPAVHLVPNSLSFWTARDHWTTPYGPAFATVIEKSSNNVPCTGGPFALCAYSGTAPMSWQGAQGGRVRELHLLRNSARKPTSSI